MFKEIIKPTLVLIVISAVIAGLLAATYNLAGIGDLGNGLEADKLEEYAPMALPSASKLVHSKVTFEDPSLLGVYKDEGGSGVTIHITTKGYGGELKMLVGIDNDGVVAGIAITESMETNGLGSKATDPTYLANFVGKSGSFSVEKSGGDIDAVAGATVSSKAIGTGVNSALKIYETVKGELV